jgi:hypothetical protein
LAGYRPTVIWSGNGYHVYIPIGEAPILEDQKEFAHINQISTKFIRFAEWYLSNGISDHAHNSTVSLNNCLLRVPGSINSKNNAMVKIVKKGEFHLNKVIPNINLIIGSFCAYLADQEIKEAGYKKSIEQQIISSRQKSSKSFESDPCNNNPYNGVNTGMYWIDRLLQTPLPDYRKRCIWKILAPYLITTKGLTYDQSRIILNDWIDRCSKLCRLQFNPRTVIIQDLNTAIKSNYFPIGLLKLSNTDKEFYTFLQKHHILDSRK